MKLIYRLGFWSSLYLGLLSASEQEMGSTLFYWCFMVIFGSVIMLIYQKEVKQYEQQK